MDDRSPGARWLALIALVLLVTVACYAPLREAPFTFEDAHYAMALDAPAQWRVPGRELTIDTFRWTAALTGTSARGFHLGNVALHLVNGALVAAVALEMGSPLGALVAAALFLWHPLNSEAVSYIAARTDVLMTTWVLLAVWCGLAWVRHGGAWRLVGLGVACLGAALSKELGLLAGPLVVLTVLAWTPATPMRRLLASSLEFGTGLVMGATWWRVATWLSGTWPWPTYVSLQAATLWRQLLLVVWFRGFSIDHDPVATAVVWRWAAVAACVACVPLLAWSWSRCRLLAFTLAWVAVCVGPRFVVEQSEFVNEHQLYTAMVGIALGAGAALASLLPPSWADRCAGVPA